jgi:hypothetical protein
MSFASLLASVSPHQHSFSSLFLIAITFVSQFSSIQTRQDGRRTRRIPFSLLLRQLVSIKTNPNTHALISVLMD